jgi:hypothetical protein
LTLGRSKAHKAAPDTKAADLAKSEMVWTERVFNIMGVRLLKSGLEKPIFLLGFPRSGTTIIFETLSMHEDLAWFSNKLRQHPKFPAVALFSRIAAFERLRGAEKQLVAQSRLQKYMPYPDECYPVWERCCGERFLYDYLVGQRASAGERDRICKTIGSVVRFQGKKRFSAKITGPSRIEYLDSLFPDAVFVHILRDPRAVVNSLLRVRFWTRRGGYQRPWWENGLTRDDRQTLDRFGHTPSALAAVQWSRVIQVARHEADAIPKERYMEIRYEEFMKDPHGRLQNMLDHCGLPSSRRMSSYMRRHAYFADQNFKFRTQLTQKDQDTVSSITEDARKLVGYA